LFAIARHQLSRWVRREAIEDRARHRLGIPPMALTDEQLERIDASAELDYVREALDQLPEGLAKAVSLRVADELPYPDVAVALGCTEAAARVRVSRGLSRLADLLTPPTIEETS
jgi:RNA polymerase sigma-70 factor (ECF subfamily)